MSRDRKSLDDDELAAEAARQRRNPGAAVVEAIRRLRNSIDALSASSDKYASRMLWLTVVLMILTAIQALGAVVTVMQWIRAGTQ
jgi:hypothetical protein